MKTNLSCNWAVVLGSDSVRKFLIFGSLTLLLCHGRSLQAVPPPITLSFANLAGTEINFGGGAFSFTSTAGYQFDVTGVSGGIGDSVGFNGYIAPGGPFTIGTITTNGAIQSAPVGGTGMLHITDSGGHDLMGSVQWENITTVGVGGILDLTGAINLTGLTYSGTSSDLSALAGAGSAADVVTFSFTPPETLTQLATAGGESSYSGTISTVPEPGVCVLMGFGCAALMAFRRRRN